MDAASEALSRADIEAIGADLGRCFEHALQRLRAGLVLLPDKPEETAWSTLRALWLTAAGQPVSAQTAVGRALQALTGTQLAAFAHSLDQRLQGVPLAHITQRQHFMGLDFQVSSEALIPRRETELLAQAGLELLPARPAAGPTLVIDACTGCGNLACAVAARRCDVRVFASDLSAQAIGLAQRNVDALSLQEQVNLSQGDLLVPLERPELLGRVDLLLCNPPYISSGRLASMPVEIINHEPRMAFDGGPFGIRVVQRLIQDAPRFLRPQGWLAFEVGLGQAPAIMRRLQRTPQYDTVRCVADVNGAPRVILARAASTPANAAATSTSRQA